VKTASLLACVALASPARARDPHDPSQPHAHSSILSVGATSVTLALPSGGTVSIPHAQLAQDERARSRCVRASRLSTRRRKLPRSSASRKTPRGRPLRSSRSLRT